MKTTFIQSLLSTVLLSSILAVGTSTVADSESSQIPPLELRSRSPDTCADPSLAEVYKQGFSPSRNAHTVNRLPTFVNANVNLNDWQVQNDAFMAWGNPQEFTFPLYILQNPETNDFINIVSTDGTVPTAAGFQAVTIIAYVYDTQVCGSVPLFSVFHDVAGTHWHTTSPTERDELLSIGWIDATTVAFVLPLTS